jgi:hypothetical protein
VHLEFRTTALQDLKPNTLPGVEPTVWRWSLWHAAREFILTTLSFIDDYNYYWTKGSATIDVCTTGLPDGLFWDEKSKFG